MALQFRFTYLLPPRPIGRGLSTNPLESAGALTCTLGSKNGQIDVSMAMKLDGYIT